MVKALPGVLVKCDPSIKALILNIDKDAGNRYVVQDLDDEEHLLVKTDQINALKYNVQNEIMRRIDTHKDDEDEDEEGKKKKKK